jgi:hypothetical protein
MKNFVVVAVFTYPFEYAILKHLLEEEGIIYVFENETMVTVSPFYSTALGGIKLRVHKNDVTATKVIIDKLNSNGSPLYVV